MYTSSLLRAASCPNWTMGNLFCLLNFNSAISWYVCLFWLFVCSWWSIYIEMSTTCLVLFPSLLSGNYIFFYLLLIIVISPSGCTFWGRKPWSRKKKIFWQLGTLVGAPVGITLVAGIAVPAMIIGIPVWVGRKVSYVFMSHQGGQGSTLIGTNPGQFKIRFQYILANWVSEMA